jgi:hypothetical protein
MVGQTEKEGLILCQGDERALIYGQESETVFKLVSLYQLASCI